MIADGGDSDVVVVDLEALFDLEGAYAAAVAATVASYGAIACDGAVEGHGEVSAGSSPEERAVWSLRVAAGSRGQPAPEAAIERGRVRRLFVAHLLGDRLHRAVFGVGAPGAAGSFASAPARVDRGGLEARWAARRGRAAVTRLPAAAALYLLAREGLTDLFDAVVGVDGLDAAPARSALVAEARARAALACASRR